MGIIPALGLLTEDDHPDGPIVLSGWELVLWSLGVAFFGVFFAVPLRKQTIIREKLRFPSGTATAQMISLLHQKHDEPSSLLLRRRHHARGNEDRPLLPGTGSPSPSSSSYYYSPPQSEQASTVALAPLPSSSPLQTDTTERQHEKSWSLKLLALTVSFTLSSAYTLLSYAFPVIYALPVFNWLTLNTIDFYAWEWYFTPSLSYVGQGIIMVMKLSHVLTLPPAHYLHIEK